jgi:hypothetical protein
MTRINDDMYYHEEKLYLEGYQHGKEMVQDELRFALEERDELRERIKKALETISNPQIANINTKLTLLNNILQGE